MSNEAKTIGDTFKQRRQELSLSLKEVENATSIRMNYLRSIEDGEMEKLISPVYAYGFVRQYAAFLGIDGEKLIQSHPHLFRPPKPQEFSYGIGTLEIRGNPTAGVKWFPSAVWILVTFAVGALAWWTARSLDLF